MADYLSALAAVCETAPRMNVPTVNAATPAAPRFAHFAEAPSYHPAGHHYPSRPPPHTERAQHGATVQTSSLRARTNVNPAPTVYETPLQHQQQQDASYLQYLTIPTYCPPRLPPRLSPETPLGYQAARYRHAPTTSLTPYHTVPAASTHVGFPPRGGDYLRRPRTPSEFLPPPPPLFPSSFPLTPPPTPKSPPAIPSSREGETQPLPCNNPVAVNPVAHAKFERFLDETWPTEPLRRGTAVIRAELYAKIADALRGSGETAARFRQWVKKSEFFLVERTQPDGSYGACLAVPAERRGSRKTPEGELAKRTSRQSTRLVARVEDFVYIIGAYHNDTNGHHGIRKTYAMVRTSAENLVSTSHPMFSTFQQCDKQLVVVLNSTASLCPITHLTHVILPSMHRCRRISVTFLGQPWPSLSSSAPSAWRTAASPPSEAPRPRHERTRRTVLMLLSLCRCLAHL